MLRLNHRHTVAVFVFTAALTNKRLTALTTTWSHYYCYVSLQS